MRGITRPLHTTILHVVPGEDSLFRSHFLGCQATTLPQKTAAKETRVQSESTCLLNVCKLVRRERKPEGECNYCWCVLSRT